MLYITQLDYGMQSRKLLLIILEKLKNKKLKV
jgi:hypothetical protein